MKILELYSFDVLEKEIKDDFNLKKFNENIYIGVDADLNVCVVTESNGERKPVKLKTKSIVLECNIRVDLSENETLKNCNVNIIKCLLTNRDDKEVFLELATLMIDSSDRRETDLVDTFNKLAQFFKENDNMCESEMIGLYAELYTIIKYEDILDLSSYWQSKDRMKFDFSFSDIDKLEVKATTKSIRVHHFRHEQLVSSINNIYILSYMLRRDDCGLSLYDLLIKSRTVFSKQSSKLYRIEKILRDNDRDVLESVKFDINFTEDKMHFYKAADIPKFNEMTPNGVSNAEYDCVLDNVPIFNENDFIDKIKSIKSKEI